MCKRWCHSKLFAAKLVETILNLHLAFCVQECAMRTTATANPVTVAPFINDTEIAVTMPVASTTKPIRPSWLGRSNKDFVSIQQ